MVFEVIFLKIFFRRHHVLILLLSSGSRVAKDMYGCSSKSNSSNDSAAWVAHGFVDGTALDPSLYGETQWSLCVTCGTWAALHLWEHMLMNHYSSSIENMKLLHTVITVLRGSILFFQEYIWIEREEAVGEKQLKDILGSLQNTSTGSDGSNSYRAHTGPTTSPENSYQYFVTLPSTTASASGKQI